MHPIPRLCFVATLFSIAIGADQISKVLARGFLVGVPPFSYFFDTLRFQYIENSGGFLGILNTLPENLRYLLLTVCVAILLAITAIYILFNRSLGTSQTAVATLIVAGGASNLIDRVINNGGVIDFLNVGIGPVRTGIFNLADIYILFGSFILGVALATGKSTR